MILTFDDCPKSLSSFKKTVKAFSDMGVRVALFPTGNCIKAGKFDAKYARKMGHYVFNHSITHPDLRTLSYAGVKRELGKPGVVTTYGHMFTSGVLVHTGDMVLAGQQIGRVGTAGDSTGCHLHFEGLTQGTYTDPLPFLAQRGVQIPGGQS